MRQRSPVRETRTDDLEMKTRASLNVSVLQRGNYAAIEKEIALKWSFMSTNRQGARKRWRTDTEYGRNVVRRCRLVQVSTMKI